MLFRSAFTVSCNRSSIDFETVIPELLNSGCDFMTLAESLERKGINMDLSVVGPLLDFAADAKQWDYVDKAMHHLADIDAVSEAAHRVWKHFIEKHGHEAVIGKVKASNIPLSKISVEVLEELRF